MFKRNDQKSQPSTGKSTVPNTSEPKYEKPKILLVDMEQGVEETLKSEGYNVEVGSFGVPYKVVRKDGYTPLVANFDVPNHAEQEIIIVDLTPSKPADNPSGEKHTSEGENDWWVSLSAGIVDPRPRVALSVQADFDKILLHGGVFIIFADRRFKQKIEWAHLSSGYGLITESELNVDCWSFLSILDSLVIEPKQGREITVSELDILPAQLLSKYIKDGEYSCTLDGSHLRINNLWVPIAQNKYGEAVAGIITPANNGHKGWVFIFPQIEKKGEFVKQLFKEVLSDFAPELFPHFEGGRWVNRFEYKLDEVLELENRIKQVEEGAKRKIDELKAEIEKQQEKFGFLNGLITQTSDSLVHAVKRALEEIGFKDVVDIDEEKEKAGDKGQLREDLQIRSKSPLVLVEVKGISNLPKEAHSLQVWKYIAPTMKKLGRMDIRGLAVINHQRNIPALERENKQTFSEDILTNAENQDFGLLTTWDLYRLVRSYIKNGWKHEQIESLFYRNGRINPIPIHYQYIGTVDRFWENVGVLSIQIESEEIRKSDRIAFELSTEFVEQDVDSLEIDNNPIEKAEPGQLVAIKTRLTKQQAKSKIRVFRVKGRCS